MGSFDFTCCVSGLPIGADDPVRYLLLTEQLPGEDRHKLESHWVLRTPPLRGRYNDYGLAEVLQRGPAQDVWLDVLQLDLIETGPGDNTFHQVAVRKDMSFEEVQTAIWMDCLLVKDRLSLETYQDTQLLKLSSLAVDRLALLKNTEELLHPSIPTVQRVRTMLLDAGLELSDGKFTPGYVVSTYDTTGHVRIRWGGGDASNHVEVLSQIQGLLSEKFSTMLTTGTGEYPKAAEMVVAAKPLDPSDRSYLSVGIEPKPQSLHVAQAMIREDIWQAICGLRHEFRDFPRTCEDYKIDVRQYWYHCHKIHRLSTDREQRTFLRTFISGASAQQLQDRLVYSLGKHFDLMLEKDPSEAELEEFLDSLGETLYVQKILRTLRYQWHPAGPTGPQCGEWNLHRDFLQRLKDIADCVIKQQAEDWGQHG